MLITLLIAVAVIQQVLDAWSTVKALNTGRALEANAPLRRLMDKAGVIPALAIVKIPMIAILVLLPEPTVVWYGALLIIVAGYTFLLVHNYKTLKKLGVL